jgi:uncharacterized membrane protein YhaH (DUF805 family)
MIAVLLLDMAVVALVSDWIHAAYLGAGSPHRPGGGLVGGGFGLLVVAVISAWSFLALKVKRAHDLGRSGWWLLIGLIPVYGVVRMIFELGFLPGSPRRNAYGEAQGYVGYDEPAPDEGPRLFVWSATEPPETPFAEPQARIEPPPPDLPVDGPVHAPTDAHMHEPPEPVESAAETVTPPLGLEEPVEPSPEPEAAAPAFVHPIMDWGKTYQADLTWPEFQPAGPDIEPTLEPRAPAQIHPPATPLAWTPAPAQEAFAELEALTLEPANDLHERL